MPVIEDGTCYPDVRCPKCLQWAQYSSSEQTPEGRAAYWLCLTGACRVAVLRVNPDGTLDAKHARRYELLPFKDYSPDWWWDEAPEASPVAPRRSQARSHKGSSSSGKDANAFPGPN